MMNRKQLYTNQICSGLNKVNKMRHFTVIADSNVAEKKSIMVTYLLFCIFYCSVCQL